jgi:serine/threonine protein kinase
MKFEQGEIIGEKYKVIKKIGAGSFGTIYLGKLNY